MGNPLIDKLGIFAPLTPTERAAVVRLSSFRTRHLRPREDLFREDQTPGDLHLILEGWACRYRTLEDGRRETLGLLICGDICDLDHQLLAATDHAVTAITTLKVAEVPHALVEDVREQHDGLACALRWSALLDGSIAREWMMSLGQRNAIERIAHLLCETFHRLRAIGRAEGNCCDFPLTQADIADATGLTVVHVNRTVQELRRLGLISLSGKKLVVRDEAGLSRIALFSPRYLHLGRDPPEASAAAQR